MWQVTLRRCVSYKPFEHNSHAAECHASD